SFYLQRPIVVVTPDGEEFTSNYIIRHYSRFAGSATLKPPSWLPSQLGGDKLFIVRADDKAHRALLEQPGLRPLGASARFDTHARGTSRTRRLECADDVRHLRHGR